MDDQALCQLIRNSRTDNALQELYGNFPMIRQAIRSQGGSLHDAEDVFQESLIVLVRKIRMDDFVLTSKLSTFLFGVCRLLWKEEQRRRKGLAAVGSEEFETGSMGSDPAAIGFDPAAFHAEQVMEDRARLAEKALDALKDRCRELLILFYEGRWKLKEIASRMGYRTEEAAKNQKYKCLENARNRLKELKQSIQTI